MSKGMTTKQLEAVERSNVNALTRRLAGELRQAWYERDCNAGQEPEPFEGGRVPVLVVVYGNGAVDVYAAPGSVSLKVVNAPRIELESPEVMELVGRYVEGKAGWRHSQLLLPRNLRGSALTSDCITPVEMLEREAAVKWLAELKRAKA